jgi:hypothetical protein
MTLSEQDRANINDLIERHSAGKKLVRVRFWSVTAKPLSASPPMT